MTRIVLLAAVLFGCSTDSNPPPAIDAPGSAGSDGSGGGSACTGAVYDPCTDPAQCQSGNCHLFMGNGFQVCTQACTPGDNTTCPTQNGAAATCNNMGICKPPGPNDCTQ